VTVDGAGGTLIPGMYEVHAHLDQDEALNTSKHLVKRFPGVDWLLSWASSASVEQAVLNSVRMARGSRKGM
jgi:hypothetical protein